MSAFYTASNKCGLSAYPRIDKLLHLPSISSIVSASTVVGEVVDEKIESPRPGSAKQAGNTSRPAAQAATIAEIDKADAPSSRKELFSENVRFPALLNAEHYPSDQPCK